MIIIGEQNSLKHNASALFDSSVWRCLKFAKSIKFISEHIDVYAQAHTHFGVILCLNGLTKIDFSFYKKTGTLSSHLCVKTDILHR